MTPENHDGLTCSPALVGAFVEVVTTSLVQCMQRSQPGGTPQPDCADVQQVIDMLRVLRPHCAAFDLLDALVLVARAQWAEAARLLDAVTDARHVREARALQALCLSSMGDPGWERVAREVGAPLDAASEDAGAAAMLTLHLRRRAELEGAMRAAAATGRFVAPDWANAEGETSGTDGPASNSGVAKGEGSEGTGGNSGITDARSVPGWPAGGLRV